jgi:hypothetical protein
MGAARACADVELRHDIHGEAGQAREAFADLVERGLPLFSADFEEARRLWGAQQTLDAEARGRRRDRETASECSDGADR